MFMHRTLLCSRYQHQNVKEWTKHAHKCLLGRKTLTSFSRGREERNVKRKKVLCRLCHHENGLDASVACNDGWANARIRYFSFCIRLHYVLFSWQHKRLKLNGRRNRDGRKIKSPSFLSPFPWSLTFMSIRFHDDISALRFHSLRRSWKPDVRLLVFSFTHHQKETITN